MFVSIDQTFIYLFIYLFIYIYLFVYLFQFYVLAFNP